MWSESITTLNPHEALRKQKKYLVYWYISGVKIYIMEFDTKEAMDAWVARTCKASFHGVFLSGQRIYYDVKEV